MAEYAELVKKAADAVQGIADEGLRRVAFEQILKHELSRHRETEGRGREHETEVHQHDPRRRKPRKGKNTHSSKAPEIRQEVEKLAISPDEPGLPPWNTLGQTDKYLWILEAAFKKHVDGLTAAGISALIFQTFRENHKTNQVNNLTKRIKKAQVRKAKLPDGQSGWQILRAGRQRLQELKSGSSKKQ